MELTSQLSLLLRSEWIWALLTVDTEEQIKISQKSWNIIKKILSTLFSWKKYILNIKYWHIPFPQSTFLICFVPFCEVACKNSLSTCNRVQLSSSFFVNDPDETGKSQFCRQMPFPVVNWNERGGQTYSKKNAWFSGFRSRNSL